MLSPRQPETIVESTGWPLRIGTWFPTAQWDVDELGAPYPARATQLTESTERNAPFYHLSVFQWLVLSFVPLVPGGNGSIDSFIWTLFQRLANGTTHWPRS
jgi:hypothetical protein